jgi:hypothetical protein
MVCFVKRHWNNMAIAKTKKCDKSEPLNHTFTLYMKYFKCCQFTIMWSKDGRKLQLNHLWIETVGVFATCDNMFFYMVVKVLLDFGSLRMEELWGKLVSLGCNGSSISQGHVILSFKVKVGPFLIGFNVLFTIPSMLSFFHIWILYISWKAYCKTYICFICSQP